MSTAPAIAIDLDGALGDTRPLWRDWLSDASRMLDIEPDELPTDRSEAAVALDATGAGNWRVLLERFADDRAPVYLRPRAEASDALRRLAGAGVRLGVFTDAPHGLAVVATRQLGVERRVELIEAGSGALERLRAELGSATTVASTLAELVAAADGADTMHS